MGDKWNDKWPTEAFFETCRAIVGGNLGERGKKRRVGDSGRGVACDMTSHKKKGRKY